MVTYISKLKWAWQAEAIFEPHPPNFEDAQLMSKLFFDISTGSQIFKEQCGRVPVISVSVLGSFHLHHE